MKLRSIQNKTPLPPQLGITLLTCSLLLHQVGTCLAAHRIQSLHRTDETASLQLYLRFNTLPEYELVQNGKRIDLILHDTLTNPSMEAIPPDDRLIKMLIKEETEKTILTLFFRYSPQSVTKNTRADPASLMLDILLGNEFSALYPDLSQKLHGITQLDRESIDYTNPVNISPYASDWPTFFQKYETPVVLSLPATYTLPPFPLATTLDGSMLREEWLPDAIMQLTDQGQWELAMYQLGERIAAEHDAFKRELLLFTYTEVMVRTGAYKRPHALLQELIQRHPDTLMADMANFLFVYLRTLHEKDYLVFFELQKAVAPLAQKTPYNSWFTLLLAELALDIGKLGTAETFLNRDDIAFHAKANAIRRMRLGDAWYLQDEDIKALVSYLQVEEKYDIIDTYPDSLNRFCDLLYTHGEYEKAQHLYKRLLAMLEGKPDKELGLFRLIISRMHAGAPKHQTTTELHQLREAFPDTEGAYRATMKQADMDYQDKTIPAQEAIDIYQHLRLVANTIALREEATFKIALVHHLEGEKEKSIRQCMLLLREFQSGSLKTEAQALIIQMLEDVLADMVAGQRYIEALVLAQQNRTLFARGWLSGNMLYDLAKAYNHVGFFDRAARTYQYLFDVSSGTQQEQIYLPLMKSLYFDGQYKTMEDYADRFSFRYPKSTLRAPVFLLQLKAMAAQGKTEQAARLLDQEHRPTSEEIEEFAVKTYYELQRWPEVILHLTEKALSSQVETDQEKALMLAEAYYQNGQPEAAQLFFHFVVDGNEENDQARFRLAQIAQAENRKEEALKLFGEIAEKGNNPLWKKLAQEEIAIMNL
ncbi:MAG: hypothetical protein CSA33_03350 [Desulfobulbus propionicus]|nr:MAG: hypothetical protein CSA33_03350 [Desulfobulbus propionicus]